MVGTTEIWIPSMPGQSSPTLDEQRNNFLNIGGDAAVGVYDDSEGKSLPSNEDILSKLQDLRVGHEIMIVYTISKYTGYHAYCLTDFREWDFLFAGKFRKPLVVRIVPWKDVAKLIKQSTS